jgi:hypothetical protein
LWSTNLPQHPWLALLGMAVAFSLSQAGGFVFFYLVERRLAHVRLPGMAAKKATARQSA